MRIRSRGEESSEIPRAWILHESPIASAAASARGSGTIIKEGEVEQTLRAIAERERR